MKKMFFLCILAFYSVYAAKPMEPLTNYNVIMVHGAADMRSGLDCENEDYEEAYSYINKKNPTDYLSRVGGYKDYALPWNEDFHGGFLYQGEGNSATGMINELREWLTEDILEDSEKRTVYLQRPFVNPAGSPFKNGDEIGWKEWKGDNKCSERRSLIEEAQEVKAKGRTSLKELRQNPALRDLLPPSRNILIAHSMGGVASREYVQGDNYKEDVDKVITLDSLPTHFNKTSFFQKEGSQPSFKFSRFFAGLLPLQPASSNMLRNNGTEQLHCSTCRTLLNFNKSIILKILKSCESGFKTKEVPCNINS